MKNALKTVLTLTSLFAASAFAQNAEVAQKVKIAEESAPSWTENESLVFGQYLPQEVSDKGFTPILNWQGEVWSNLSGVSGNTMFDSLLTFGFEWDLAKLFNSNKPLGRIGMTNFYYESTDDLANAGEMSDASNIFTGAGFRVFEIYYANEFETDAGTFSFRIGQLAADEDFMGLDYADLFLNSSFGAIPSIAGGSTANGAIAFSQYANATAGLTLGYQHKGWDVKLGIYNGNAGFDEKSNQGFDYELQGVALWYQVGYNYEIADLSGYIAFGGSYNSNEFERFGYDEVARNLYSFYLLLQQDILANDEGDAILGAFARVAYNPSGAIAENKLYIDAGLNWFAPIPTRENDVFGIAVGFTQAGKEFRRALELPTYETCLEATYRTQITKAIALQPSFQVYFNPTDSSGNRGTKYILGARAEINF